MANTAATSTQLCIAQTKTLHKFWRNRKRRKTPIYACTSIAATSALASWPPGTAHRAPRPYPSSWPLCDRARPGWWSAGAWAASCRAASRPRRPLAGPHSGLDAWRTRWSSQRRRSSGAPWLAPPTPRAWCRTRFLDRGPRRRPSGTARRVPRAGCAGPLRARSGM